MSALKQGLKRYGIPELAAWIASVAVILAVAWTGMEHLRAPLVWTGQTATYYGIVITREYRPGGRGFL